MTLVLAGANPSAEGEDADDGGDDGADSSPVLDLAQSFRWQKIDGVSKKAYSADLKSNIPSITSEICERLTLYSLHEEAGRANEDSWQE